MKVFIVTDMEGVSGCTGGGYGVRLTPEVHSKYLSLMMGEINAVVEGCVQGGAEEIIVGEAHPVDLAALHPDAKLARGLQWHKAPYLRKFDAVLFVGQHARTNLSDAVRSHTGSSKSITGFWINERPAGELAYIGGLFGAKGVPVIFLSGDDAACREAEEWVPGIITAAVEEALSVHGAICLPPAKTHPLLTARAKEAVQRPSKGKPIVIAEPSVVRIEFAYPQIADSFCISPGTVRIDARTVSYSAPTYEEAYTGSVGVLTNVLVRYDS